MSTSTAAGRSSSAIRSKRGRRPAVGQDRHQLRRAGREPPRQAARAGRRRRRISSAVDRAGAGQLTSSPPSRSGFSSVAGRSRTDVGLPRPTGRRRAARASRRSRGVDRDGRLAAREDERAADRVRVDDDPVARLELALEQRPGERVLDEPLDRPLERPRPERRVVPSRTISALAAGGQVDRQVLRGEPPRQVGDEQVDDRRQLRLGQGVEDDDLVDPVEELGPELEPQRLRQLAPSSPRRPSRDPRRSGRRSRSPSCRRCWS